ncbi:MAG: hypothetical protein JO189_19765 [Deltaproteobacteria bacterium]|nr:hypothetical protein [Deltaproteobacteria bacterium]
MLTGQQLKDFHQCGIVRMSRAIAPSAVDEMLRSVWNCWHDRYHIHREALDTWPELDNAGVHQVIGVQRFTGSHHLPKWEKFAQIGTPSVCEAFD